jgi:hypothetical protein
MRGAKALAGLPGAYGGDLTECSVLNPMDHDPDVYPQGHWRHGCIDYWLMEAGFIIATGR